MPEIFPSLLSSSNLGQQWRLQDNGWSERQGQGMPPAADERGRKVGASDSCLMAVGLRGLRNSGTFPPCRWVHCSAKREATWHGRQQCVAPHLGSSFPPCFSSGEKEESFSISLKVLVTLLFRNFFSPEKLKPMATGVNISRT